MLQIIFHKYQNKNYKFITSFVNRPLEANKTGFNLIFFQFDIRGKLSITLLSYLRNDHAGMDISNILSMFDHMQNLKFRSPFWIKTKIFAM